MTQNSRLIHFWKMSWKEVDALDHDSTLIIIPTGAIEQHGPHLPIDTDIFNATVIFGRYRRTLYWREKTSRGGSSNLVGNIPTPSWFPRNALSSK